MRGISRSADLKAFHTPADQIMHGASHGKGQLNAMNLMAICGTEWRGSSSLFRTRFTPGIDTAWICWSMATEHNAWLMCVYDATHWQDALQAQCRLKPGPTSRTLAQAWPGTGWTPRVYRPPTDLPPVPLRSQAISDIYSGGYTIIHFESGAIPRHLVIAIDLGPWSATRR